MKLPVVSGAGQSTHFERSVTPSMNSTGATSSSGALSPRIDASPVPNHKELAKGTLRALIREAGLTVDEFARLL